MTDSAQLPIYELEGALVDALRTKRRAIVRAPTGSGKSTQLPRMLHAHGFLETGELVVLQPRRLAARMLARRVAQEMRVELGGLVGYQIRLESRVSAETRIRFVTEGVLLRRMLSDPELRGVGALVFDEFHERHLYGDISLARALQIQQTTRPDLCVVVMSATLESARLAEYLHPAPVLESQGRSHPVAIRYLPKRVDFAREPVWEVAARECARLMGETDGDALIFMPGAYEINRTVQALSARVSHCDVLPLHGELSPEQQDRAVAGGARRKVIVSTNVAETSLTIEGVTLVIDSGLARQASFDAQRGFNTLLVGKISRAAADQRAGRAGRTAPGVCLRLWTEREHAQRPAQELPEVRRLDLCEVVLTLKAGGVEDVANFPWFEAPDAVALARAEALLVHLGALHGPGRLLTETGARMLRFPVHPRYARMLIEAGRRGCVREVALMAALTQGRSLLVKGRGSPARDEQFADDERSDFFRLMNAWRYAVENRYDVDACQRLGIHAQGARAVRPLFEQFLAMAREAGLPVNDGGADPEAMCKCVLAGFSDQLARRMDRGTLRCRMLGGRRGTLARESVVQNAGLIVAAEVTELGKTGGAVETLLSLCTAVEETWLQELFPEDCRETVGVFYDPVLRRVQARLERCFRDLVLESRPMAELPSEEASAKLLAREVLAGNISLGLWNEAVEQWIVRVNRLAEWFPELEVAPIAEGDRSWLVEQICHGCYGAKELRDKPVMPVLQEWLRPEQLAVLDTYLPERIVMGNGRRARIRYALEGPPVLSARIQELYGIDAKFSLGNGRVPVRFEILAPNQRPIQVTDDLTRFWQEMYPKVKAELSRRYPRHEWR